ncbi:MAG: FtsX-like permease family protein [Anaerolineales bacterium]|nr:FtsX-like permease family protein [Anaerolineales bacterium]
MRSIAHLALRELRRSWVRNLFAALAVGAGIATIIASDLISRGITEEIADSAEGKAITAFMGEQLEVGLTAIGLVITVAAGFLIFNAFAMSTTQRREDFGRMRAVGMTRRQLLLMVLLEASLTGMAGTAFGLLSGVGLARSLMFFVMTTSNVFNRFGEVSLSPGRLLLGAAIGLGTTILAALLPAVRASRIPPVAAMQAASSTGKNTNRYRVAGGCALLIAAMWVFLIVDPPGKWILPPWSSYLAIAFLAAWLLCIGLALPAIVGISGDWLRRPLTAILHVPGRLAAGNLRRARARVTFMLLTLIIGVAMIISVTGFLEYWFEELFFRTSGRSLKENPGMGFFPLEIEGGLQAYENVFDFTLPDNLIVEVEAAAEDQATVVQTYFVLSPELSFLGEYYFSFVLDPQSMQQAGELFFTFTYGDWTRALEIADADCGLFLTPTVAQKNDAWLYDTISIQTPLGSLDCTIAGIGPTFVGASIISDTGLSAFNLDAPVMLSVFPYENEGRAEVLAEFAAIADRYPGIWFTDLALVSEMQMEAMATVRTMMSGMLILAILSATLGVVNTTLISVSERRREYGVLRAAGATRRQVNTVVIVEGLLFGLIGAGVGILAGIGVVVIYIVVFGGSVFGYPDFPVWEVALASIEPALSRGILALIVSPLLIALAAWLPALSALRGSVIETLGRRKAPP